MKIKSEFIFLRTRPLMISRFLFTLALFMSVCLPELLQANSVSSDFKWKGTVHYRYEYKKLYQWSESNRHCSLSATSDWGSTLDVFLIVSFEGDEGGRAVDPVAKAYYSLLVNTECQWKRDHEICAGKVEINAATWEDRQKGTRKVSPGHTGKMTTTLDTKGYKGETSLDLYVDEESGTFTLLGQGEVKAPQPAFKSEEVFRDACSGKTDRKTENLTYPDTGAMWFFNVQGEFTGNTISGTEILEDDTTIPEGEKDTPTSNAHMSCNFPIFRSAPTEYLKRKTVSWNFRRVGEDDCVGMVTYISGDVNINGQKSDIGPVPLREGSRIETGPNGRILIVFPEQGVEYRFGSNTSLELPDPCHKENLPPDRLIKGLIYSIISKIKGGRGAPPQLSLGNCPSGVRGLPTPLPDWGGTPLLLASFAKPAFLHTSSVQVDDQSLKMTELAPNETEIEEADRFFIVERIPDQFLRIKAVKGGIKLKDSSGEEKILEPGQAFWKSLKPGEEAGPLKELLIVADEQ